MSVPIVSKIFFTITYPTGRTRSHVPMGKLRSLAKKQLSDVEIIETIDHLFACQRCFETYRFIRTAHLAAAS